MNTAYERLKTLSGQLTGTASPVANDQGASRREKVLTKHADDIVITCALRTPLTKGRKGGLKDTLADDLLISILKVGLLQKQKGIRCTNPVHSPSLRAQTSIATSLMTSALAMYYARDPHTWLAQQS